MTLPFSKPTVPWSTRLMAMAALAGTALTFAHPSATRQFTWPWVGLMALGWMIPVAVTGFLAARHEIWHRPNALLSTGLVVLALATLFSAFFSPFAQLSWLRIWPTLGGVALFFWLHNWLADASAPAGTLTTESRVRSLVGGICFFGAAFAVISAVGWRWKVGPGAWSTRNDVPFGHSTYTAGILVMLLPWLVHAVWKAHGVRRVGWFVAAATGFLALFATSSRGGVLALVAVGAVVAIFIFARARWSRRHKLGLLVAIGGLLALAILTNPRLRELVQGGGWGASARESNSQRTAMLDAGWRMGADRPWTGWGPGTVPVTYPKFRQHLHGGVDNVLQLHNTPIQIWAALGAGGLVAMLLLAMAGGRRLWQSTRDSAADSILFTAAASVFGYILFALTDHQLDLPALNALLVLNLALLFHGELPLVSRRARLLIVGPGIAVSAVVLAGLSGRDLAARYAYEQSLSAFEAGESETGFLKLKTAAARAPYDPYYRHLLAVRLLDQRSTTSDPALRQEWTEHATAQLEQSLATGGFTEFANFNLGWLRLETGDPAKAVWHFRAAAREAPHRSGVYFGLGLALRGAGDESAAIRAFALEWLNEPFSFTAPVWEWPDFAPLRPRVEREALTLLAELAPEHPEARYLDELWHWWSSRRIPRAAGFNPETNAFFATLQALDQKQRPPAAAENYGWGKLHALWSDPTEHTNLTALLPHDASLAGSMSRRQMQHPFPDWHGFFTAGVENDSALLASYRSERTGYGVLALHPDGPLLTDLYVRQENRAVAAFAGGLFPGKGWIPARELIKRLPPAAPSALKP